MLLLLITTLLSTSQGLYTDPGNPYDDGPLLSVVNIVSYDEGQNGAPINCTIFYPDYSAEEVGLSVFIGGFYGAWPGTMYTETLRRAASHGFVVLALNTAGNIIGYEQNLLDAMDWAEANLNSLLPSRIDWNAVQVTCHSAGCYGAMLLLRARPTFFKSTVMTDPATWDIENPVDFVVPGLFYGSGLAGSCVVQGWTFDTFYENWPCPRILQVVSGFGHCDYFDDIPWSVCDATGFCQTGPESGIAAQRQFVQGLMAGMFMWKIQGQARVVDYLTDAGLIPVALDQLLSDVGC